MSRGRERPTGLYFAGWVFADLLLVIVLVVLGGELVLPTEPERPGPTAAPTTSVPAPEPTPTRTSRPAGLDPRTRSITVRADADALLAGAAGARADLIRQIRREIVPFEGRRAAFVLVFGTVRGPGGVDNQRSDTYATAVARLLPRTAPEFFPPYSEKIIRGYHDSSADIASGTARIELFFLHQ